MTILDRYILKRYLVTFFVMLLLFIPIGIMAHMAEQIGKIQEREAPLGEVLVYLGDFSIYIGSLLLPIFLFLSVIFFTSKLASNTEIVAMLSSGISFNRFLRPYLIGATMLAVFVLFMGMFVVPSASKGFNEFKYKYLKSGVQERVTTNIFNQLNEHDFIYVSSFDPARDIGYNFTFERFKEDNTLDFKMEAANIRWIDSLYRMTTYSKRTMVGNTERIETKGRLDTLLNFKIDDLTPVSYVAETKNLLELDKFIADQRRKGASNINSYVLVKYKRWALPLSVFILTIIGVAVASVKRRGGMGLNLAFGIVVAFIFIFFDRIFSTLAEQAGLEPILAVVIPNTFFGILAFVLLQKAKR
ncbi:MAG: LptF/LptG family permease [Flavobacteriaceae bacterium]